jgi:hypothetical protein
MVYYTCQNCGTIFDKKSHYDKHLERKFPCVSLSFVFTCSYCGVDFDTQGLLNKHYTRCKKKQEVADNDSVKELEKAKQEIIQLKDKLAQSNINTSNILSGNNSGNNSGTHNGNNNDLSTNYNINNTNNNTINNTINNQNIMIVSFGKEDINRLSKREKREILNSSYAAIYNCAKKMNFNPNIPEQNNIFITNPKAEFAYKFDQQKFIALTTNDLLAELIHHRSSDVRELMEQNDELKVAQVKIDRVTNLLNIIDEEKPETMANLKKELKLTLFNDNELALENKQKFDEQRKKIKNKK